MKAWWQGSSGGVVAGGNRSVVAVDSRGGKKYWGCGGQR